jgi:serine/threonine-protein kinase
VAIGPGTRIGPYEVTALLGEGGMGKVWRAHHAALKRDDALKVLPEVFAADPERLARFQREAQVLASLNHPNIAHVYGLEEVSSTGSGPAVNALVMELVEGETLADRLASDQGSGIRDRGSGLLVDEALAIAKQIAEALEAAHEQGIVHRDLKPGNIKLRPDGTVKVLDFGLAKAMETVGSGRSPAGSESMSPTITTPAMTQAGLILGTAAYMSPEQARGRPVDARTDIWAFGAVLYEMLTGRRAFDGEDTTEVLGAVVRLDPDWEALPGRVTPRIRQVLRACLQKNPKQRIAHVQDVRLALEGVFETETAAAALEDTREPLAWWRQPRWLSVVAAGILLAAGLGAGWAVGSRSGADMPTPQVRRFPVAVSPSVSLPVASGTLVTISPDGQTLVYRGEEGGIWRLYQHRLDQLLPTPIPGTEGAGSVLFFSPDGEWVAFQGNGGLMRVSLAGGRPVSIAASVPSSRGGSWGPDGTIVLGLTGGSLATVLATGGAVEPLAEEEGGRSIWYPQVLPGRRALLFTASDPIPDGGDVKVLDLETGEQRTIVAGGVAGHYTPTGHIVFLRGGDLWAAPFDLDTLTVRGQPALVEQGIRVETGGAVQFAVANDGSLAYLPSSAATARYTLVWVDREGRETPINTPPRTYIYPRISPDGTQVALDVRDEQNDIWVWSLARETLTRLTFDPGFDRAPVWSPDGRRIAYMTGPGRQGTLLWRPADGTGTAEALTEAAGSFYPASFSPDGEFVVVNQDNVGDSGWDVMLVPVRGERTVTRLVQSSFNERNGEVSPDGRWLAYQSDESGQFEVYVRPFPDTDSGGRWQVSPAGGTRPVWGRVGTELFYLIPPGRVMTVPVTLGESFTYGNATPLFDGPYVAAQPLRTYDVAPDGQRFLMIKAAAVDPEETGEEGGSVRIVVVQHWLEELKRLVPTEF